MNCVECKSRLYPDDPSVSQWDRFQRRYLPPVCQFCNMPREALESPSVPDVKPANDNLYRSKLHEHLVRMNDLESRLNSHIDAAKIKRQKKDKEVEDVGW